MPKYRVHFKDGSSVGPIEAESAEVARRKALRMGVSARSTGPFQPLAKSSGGVDKVEREQA